ncbi:MAG: Alcohol dehydrogenase GroES domain protein [Myxococcales bacterium]|nr:Alcohol dehydrogenase GroES domain protein [Myxococcales bacterium]
MVGARDARTPIMKAVVYKSPCRVEVQDVTDPRLEAPTDVIVKITTSGICGSDLHMYEGRTPSMEGMVLGHENMGVIEEVGTAVVSIKKGDRVVIPFNVSCGFCFNCERGFTNACLTVNPEGYHGGYGYAKMGPFRGGQAEYLRVPYGDFNCLKLPGKPGDGHENDFLLLSDVFPTGYYGTELAGVVPGATVAVFGAGPVGLLAAYSAMLRGAAEVYVIDCVQARLAKASDIGAIPIDFTQGDPVEQIFELRSTTAFVEARRPGEEKMPGVMCGIDAVGYQARDREQPEKERPTQVLEDLIRVVNPTGRIGVVGVYMPSDPGAPSDAAKHGQFQFPLGSLFERELRLSTGQTPVKRFNRFLRDLIIAGRARPSFIISHRLPLAEAPDAYQKFDRRSDGYTKVVLDPQRQAA